MAAAIHLAQSNRMRGMWVALGLALWTALGYILIAQGVLGVGDLQTEPGSAGIVYVAAGCYFLGGLLILVHRRWLWIFGLVMNSLVIMIFLRMYQARPAVLFSPGGVVTKAAQILLELALIYLIAADFQRARSR
jgi:hypothetical protein